MWQVDSATLDDIAIGAGILGTGGGGNPYYGKLRLLKYLQNGAKVDIVDPAEVADDALVVSVGGMGAPTVGFEKIQRGDEQLTALRALEAHVGRKVDYLISGEVGGGNSIAPMIVSAQTGLPVVDGDGMGRAFPELQHCSFSIYGVKCTPAAIADVKHNKVIFDDLDSTKTLERFARAVTVQMGGSSGYAFPLMSGAEMKRTVVPRTLALARRVGEAVQQARRQHTDPLAAILAITDGAELFRGKVVDLQRRLVAGFARGNLTLDGLENDRGSQLAIDLQNEYLIARRDGEVIAVVPDLICLVDLITAEPITTEVIRYGLRCAVLGIPCHDLLKTPRALEVIGPAAFGYPEVEFVPMPGRYARE